MKLCYIARRKSSSCREPTTTASLVTIQLATTNPLCKSLTHIDQLRPTTALTTTPTRSTMQTRWEYPSSNCIPQPVFESGFPLGSCGTGPLMRFANCWKHISSSRHSSFIEHVNRCMRKSLSNAGSYPGGLGSSSVVPSPAECHSRDCRLLYVTVVGTGVSVRDSR
jgi:hypothetical protein